MKRIIVAAVLIACFFVTAGCETLLGPTDSLTPFPETPPNLSPPYNMLIEGEPNLNFITIKGGYYIWKVGNSWHVRVAKTDNLQPIGFQKDFFTGTIRVEGGYITNIERQNIRAPDDMQPDSNSIFYRFEVQSEVKGMNFNVRSVISDYCIIFAPQINGFAIPEYVRLGRAMVTPDMVPIRMCFRP